MDTTLRLLTCSMLLLFANSTAWAQGVDGMGGYAPPVTLPPGVGGESTVPPRNVAPPPGGLDVRSEIGTPTGMEMPGGSPLGGDAGGYRNSPPPPPTGSGMVAGAASAIGAASNTVSQEAGAVATPKERLAGTIGVAPADLGSTASTSLEEVLGAKQTAAGREAATRAYWALCERIGEFAAHEQYAALVEANSQELVYDQSIVLTAQSDRGAALLAVKAAQLDLLAAIGAPTDADIPWPIDAPTTGRYVTKFDALLQQGRSIPVAGYRIDRSLPVLYEAIQVRHTACMAAEARLAAASKGLRERTMSFGDWASAAESLRDQRIAFVGAVARYNVDIAGYVKIALGEGAGREQWVRALIGARGLHSTNRSGGGTVIESEPTGMSAIEPPATFSDQVEAASFEEVAPPRPVLGQSPTPASPNVAPASDVDALSIGVPGSESDAPAPLATPAREPDRIVPTDRPTPVPMTLDGPAESDRASVFRLVAWQAPTVTAVEAAPVTIARSELFAQFVGPDDAQKAAGVAEFFFATENVPPSFGSHEATPLTLRECLSQARPGLRFVAVDAYWRCAEAFAVRSYLLREVLELERLMQWTDVSSATDFAASLKSVDPAFLPLIVVCREMRAESLEARVELFEAQADLLQALARPIAEPWPIASTMPTTAAYDLNIGVAPTAAERQWPVRRAESLLPEMETFLREQASTAIELDAVRSATLVGASSGTRSVDDFAEVVVRQKDAARRFFILAALYNRTIAQYALAVLPEWAPIDQIEEAMRPS